MTQWIEIELGKNTETVTNGIPRSTTTWTRTYANKRSVRQSEFYEAARVGLKPEIMLEVRASEYDDHHMARIGAKAYSILRAYSTGDIVELILSASTGGEA